MQSFNDKTELKKMLLWLPNTPRLLIVNTLSDKTIVPNTEGIGMAHLILWKLFSGSRLASHRAAAGAGRFAALRATLGDRFAALRFTLDSFVGLARDRRGMSAIEFGVAAPIFLGILMPVVDLGRAFSQQIQIRQAVQAGALYASVNVYNTGTWSSNVSSAVTNSTTLAVSPTVGSETCGCPNSTSTDISSHDTLSTCGRTNGGTDCSDGSIPGYYVTITGTLSYSPVMPYSILANPTTLSAQAVVRIQ